MPETAALDPVRVSAAAAVLTRLWGGLVREPIDGLGDRETSGGSVQRKLPDGRTLRGSAAAAEPFAAPITEVSIDGVAFTDPADLVRALGLPGATDRLAAELANSVDNLALARAAQPAPDGGAPTLHRARSAPDPLAYTEQLVVDGHPLHPCCRTRIGLSTAEVRAYAPEHHGIVELREVVVPAGRWYGVDAAPVLWLHPWQADHVLDRYPWLRPTGTTRAARPLLSLRTLALVDRPDQHLKTALDVQMTSAVRTVSPAALHNGPLLSRLLLGLAGRTPGLGILPETGAGAALVDGAPCRSLAQLYRRVPVLGAGEVALPLAALAAPSPATGAPLLTELTRDPLAFIGDLAGLALPALFTLLELGIALEAHGQNLLLVLRGDAPARLLYRDLGGVRVSPARLARHGIEAPRLLGDLPTDDPEALRTKVLASAVGTVLAEVVATAVTGFGIEPGAGWDRIAAVARTLAGPDASALFAATLPVKAMTAMRLAAAPLDDVWAELPNPLAGLR